MKRCWRYHCAFRRTLRPDNPPRTVEATNGLESYCHTLLAENAKLQATLQETLKWLQENHEKNEVEAKQKKLESLVKPMIQKLYQSSGGQGMPAPYVPERPDDWPAYLADPFLLDDTILNF